MAVHCTVTTFEKNLSYVDFFKHWVMSIVLLVGYQTTNLLPGPSFPNPPCPGLLVYLFTYFPGCRCGWLWLIKYGLLGDPWQRTHVDDPSFSLHGLISSALMKLAHGASLLPSMEEEEEGGDGGLWQGKLRKEKDLVVRRTRESWLIWRFGSEGEGGGRCPDLILRKMKRKVDYEY